MLITRSLTSAVDRLQLQEGDLIVLASDGLWDNLFPAEILKFLVCHININVHV